MKGVILGHGFISGEDGKRYENAANLGASLNSAFSNLGNKASSINLSQSAELTNGII